LKPHALVTNDDGIESGFLQALVEALSADFRVSVAAPTTEQSWIGRAMTRRGEIEVAHLPELFSNTEAVWSIGGTPTDCVNIALGHLLPEKPDIVLSGINIGYNTTEALILSSGTVAGATEGALWGLPAIAFSKCVPKDLFMEISRTKGRTSGAFSDSLRAAANRAVSLSTETLQHPPKKGCVLNINFPAQTHGETPVVETHPAKVDLGSLFEKSGGGNFRFYYHSGLTVRPDPASDRAALEAGKISRTLLDFSKVGHP